MSGANGSGKSTLLSALAGRLPLTAGGRRVAPGAVVVKLGQAREALTGDGTLVDQVRELTGLDEPSARTALALFGLSAEITQQRVATHDRQLRDRLRLDREFPLLARDGDRHRSPGPAGAEGQMQGDGGPTG